MSETKDAYDWWRRAVAGEKIGGPTLPVHDGEPQLGYYRKRISAAGAFTGVAIYMHGDAMVALEGKDRMVDPNDIWTWVAKYPVTYAAYEYWAQNGRWPDMDKSVEGSLAHAASNSADLTEDQKKKAEIDTALEAVKTYQTIADDESLARAQSARSRLLELSGDADKIREREKAPHLEAGRKVDTVWQPLVKTAKDGADKIRAVMSAYVTARDKKAEEERRQAEEKARIEAEKAAKKGRPAPPPEPQPATVAPEATTIRPGYGRAAAITEKKVVTVTDQDACYQSLKSHPELVTMIHLLAQRAVAAGKGDQVQGIKIDIVKDVR